MEYKYPPIFKYIILLMCIFMFIKHLNIMVNHQNLMISISIIIMIMIFDYILIDNHPELLGNNDSNENFTDSSLLYDSTLDKDIDDILENYDIDDFERELDDDADLKNLEYPNYEQKAFYQLPTDYRKPSYDSNIDCYRRGDGRGNTKPNQRFYTKDIL